jgi:phosphoglycerate kinase
VLPDIAALPDIASLGDLDGKRIHVRCDFNVPLDHADGAPRITDDGRIRASLPTLRRLLDAQAALTISAHLGRPKGQPRPDLSLEPVARRLGELLDLDVAFVPDPTGDPGGAAVTLLENIRFDPRETAKDAAERRSLAQQLAAGADAYVGDAFGAVHRAHASVVDLPAMLPHAAGGLVRREVEVLSRLTTDPARPYVVVLGGSKVSDKLAVIENLLPTVDMLCVGGGMCFTFLAACGLDVGRSLLEPDQVDACRKLLDTGKIVLPSDVVVATEVSADATVETVRVDAIPPDHMGLDIGPESVAAFGSRLNGASTVFWNGPMGVFELPLFAGGTRGVARAISELPGALTVVGGGDSAAAVRTLGLDESAFGHISTGGGASLEYLEGRSLPGLAALAA